MGAFEDAVKKKEAELAAKKADASDRLNVLEEANPTYRLGQEVPVSRTIDYRSAGLNAEMLKAMRDTAAGYRPMRDLAGSARIAAMKEEERGKAMKKYASMKEK